LVVATVGETPTWVITSGNPSAIAEDILRQKGAQVFRVAERNGQLDLAEVMKVLAEQGITRLIVEGGPKVAASLVAADLVDEAVLVRADRSLGSGIGALEGMPLEALTGTLQARSSERLGTDTLEAYERV
jgi:diaminohydroxyphosphoribosylaminopyrimidine deaminase/5-amino-6-(5-phosphoribosylamino)uracil reductase